MGTSINYPVSLNIYIAVQFQSLDDGLGKLVGA
jgi:hypothetical protein